MHRKKLLTIGLMFVFLMMTGCIDRKSATVEETVAEDSLAADSVATDTIVDLVEVPQSKAIDELFDDFFFNFAGNRRMQMSRIAFPLSVEKNGNVAKLQRRQWKYSHFFMGDGFYMMLLDNSAGDSLSKSYNLTRASVEKIYLLEDRMKEYDFQRSETGEWQLVKIAHKELSEHPCAEFLRFYERFARDTTFQMASLNDFVVMTAPDADEESETGEITGSIMPEQWPAFKPVIIPQGVIYCVNYGQRFEDENQKVVVVRGIANGLNIQLMFERKGDAWKLMKFQV